NHEAMIAHSSIPLSQPLVVTFQGGDVFGLIRDRLWQARGRIRKVQFVVDYYFIILEKFGESAPFYPEPL
ncbi:MAG TPA: hypothetical protein VLH40_00300, partial [Atribacteraceae bacterium]|nr:hypothetical protein [Atribacteraceae bacterium]